MVGKVAVLKHEKFDAFACLHQLTHHLPTTAVDSKSLQLMIEGLKTEVGHPSF